MLLCILTTGRLTGIEEEEREYQEETGDTSFNSTFPFRMIYVKGALSVSLPRFLRVDYHIYIVYNLRYILTTADTL